GDREPLALLAIEVADGFEETAADADALVVGQHDDPRDAPQPATADGRKQAAEGDRLVLPGGHVTAGGPVELAAQIMMRRKQPPQRAAAAKDLQGDRRSPKPPP